MVRHEDIHPLKEFRANLPTHLDQIEKEGRPVMITRHGRPAGILLSPVAYDALVEKATLLEDVEAIKQGIADFRAGRGVEAGEALRRIVGELGLRIDR